MTFKNVPAAPSSLAGTRAGRDTQRIELSHPAEPHNGVDLGGSSASGPSSEPCRRCGGAGVIPVRGESLNPFSGVESWNPELDDDYPCPRCDGQG